MASSRSRTVTGSVSTWKSAHPTAISKGIGSLVYGPVERRLLAAATGCEKVHLFYRLWSLKEALIKGLGAGFSLNPSRFEVPPAMLQGERSGSFRFPHAPANEWRLLDLGEPRFAAALAYKVSPSDSITTAGRER